AWVFAMLCWQQGLDVVMLEVPLVDEGSTMTGETTFWLPALLRDGQLYLFDARLGLPIPGPGGEGVATLQQVQADDSLLRQLDLEDSSDPISADQLGAIEAAIVADPFRLSKRAASVDAKLSGDNKLSLSMKAARLVGKISELEGIGAVKLWAVPFETLRNQ